MKITAIKPQEKRKGRANIFVDGAFRLGVSEAVVADFGIYVGKEITQKELELLRDAENLNKAIEKAYRLLSFRQRSHKELTEKLKEKFEPETIQKVLKKLEEYGYVDDKKFAESWVAERKISKGKRALYFELVKKGVEKEIIEDVLESLEKEEEVQNATNAALKKKIYLALPEPERRQKVTAFLARRGFSYDVIKEVFKELKNF